MSRAYGEKMSFYDKVYEVVERIPSGSVATYGQIARICGSPKASRAVGFALHANPRPEIIPCHRVVNRNGRLAPSFAFGGANAQKQLLEKEGICVSELNTVDLGKYLWTNSDDNIMNFDRYM